jgi:hypothetical protein
MRDGFPVGSLDAVAGSFEREQSSQPIDAPRAGQF